MKELSKSYIYSICLKFEACADKSIRKKKNDTGLRFLKALSYIRYKFYLGIKNEFIENEIQVLSEQITKTEFKYNKEEKSIVIIDEINADYIGLMVQYVDALIMGGYRIQYLYEQKEHPHVENIHLMQALNRYEKAQIKQIPSNVNGFSKSQWLYNEICGFGSKKILQNFGEWAIEACVACAALPNDVIRYRINAADHCFWAGASCADVTFEFRHYGANLTYNERGFKKDEIVYIPFYPLLKDTPFEGFPIECTGKFVFFSGGAIYKIVDNNNSYFRLCKLILSKCPDSVIIFAGADGDNSVLKRGIEQFGLQGRFIPIGYRKDILEVFKHCDVFINTHPLGGGLMCQYAAHCSKPILNYLNKGDEECVSQKTECQFTSYSEQDLLDEAVKLYNSKEYREEKGRALKNAVITKDEFDKSLLCYLNTGNPTLIIKWDDSFVPKEYCIEDSIAYNNKKNAAFYYKLFQLLGKDSLLVMPGNVFSLGIYGIKWQLRKLLKR